MITAISVVVPQELTQLQSRDFFALHGGDVHAGSVVGRLRSAHEHRAGATGNARKLPSKSASDGRDSSNVGRKGRSGHTSALS